MMRTLRHALLAAVLLLAVSAGAPSGSLAATADAWANIDIASISVLFSGTGSSTYRYQTSARAGDRSDADTGAGPIVEAVAEVDAHNHWAWGLVDNEDLYAQTYVNGDDGVSGLASSDAGWYGQFRATGAGTLTISFDYYLAYDVDTGANEKAWADALAVLTIGDRTISDLLWTEAFNTMAFDDETPWATLSLKHDMQAGDLVDFTALVSARSEVDAVPVPAAFWLLGSGLIGLCGTRITCLR